jgi:hypothetical protein
MMPGAYNYAVEHFHTSIARSHRPPASGVIIVSVFQLNQNLNCNFKNTIHLHDERVKVDVFE